MRTHSMRNSNKIFTVIKLDEENLQRRPRMLTRDLFAVAKLLVNLTKVCALLSAILVLV